MTDDEKTTQDQLTETAHEYGWRVVEVYGGGKVPKNTFRYKRSERLITVTYTKAGTVKEAELNRPGLAAEVVPRLAKDKYDIVDKWIRKQ